MSKLFFTKFSSLEKWHIEQYLREELIGKFKMIPLSKILIPLKERISSQEYISTIPLVEKIRFSDGQIFYRHNKKPKNHLYVAYKDNLLVSNINFEKGAFCVVSEEKIVCSTDYQPYKIISDEIIPDYLNLCLRCPKFLKNVSLAKPKGMKTRARWEFIRTFSIPVPSLDEQNRLLFEFYKKNKEADDIIQTSRSRVDNYFVEELAAMDFCFEQKSSYSFGFINLKNLTRWDSWVQDTGVKSEKYEVVPFGRLVLEKPQYGANVKGVDKVSEYRYIRITDINDDGSLNKVLKYPEKVEEAYILDEDDFLIARSGNTVGKTFLYKKNYGPAIYAGYLIRYILNKDLVVPEYLMYYTKTMIFKNWVLKNQRIAGQPNINGQEYLSFPVILPPLDVQNSIVKEIAKIFNQIQNEQNVSKSMLEQAKSDFECAIFE